MTVEKLTPKNIDEYIAGFPANVQAVLKQIRAVVRMAAPEAEETIKYGMPTFTFKGNLVYFAAFKKHIGFYPPPTGLEKFKAQVASYAGPKGSLIFPLDKPMPYDLIAEIVRFRVQENLARYDAKKKKNRV